MAAGKLAERAASTLEFIEANRWCIYENYEEEWTRPLMFEIDNIPRKAATGGHFYLRGGAVSPSKFIRDVDKAFLSDIEVVYLDRVVSTGPSSFLTAAKIDLKAAESKTKELMDYCRAVWHHFRTQQRIIQSKDDSFDFEFGPPDKPGSWQYGEQLESKILDMMDLVGSVADLVGFYHTYDQCVQILDQQQGKPKAIWIGPRKSLEQIFAQLANLCYSDHDSPLLTSAPVELRREWVDYWVGLRIEPPNRPLVVRGLDGDNKVLGYLMYQLRSNFKSMRAAGPTFTKTFTCWTDTTPEGLLRTHVTGKKGRKRPGGPFLAVGDKAQLVWTIPG